MSIEIRLDKFQPRHYQLPIFDAVENKGYRRVISILPRRAGKDMACWNLAIRFLLRKPAICYYIFPEYQQAKKAIWDTLTHTGQRFLDYIPQEVIESTNSQEMKIRFKNGSLLQLCGSDNYNSLMGTNPSLCIFSEFAMQDPMAWNYLRPILANNDGTAIFISTPRGFNHMHTMYERALVNNNWYAQLLTCDDTNHMSPEALAEEKKDMPEDLFQQEYYCSFSLGVEGSIYSKILDKMKLAGQLGAVNWDTAHKVHTSWDIGRDATAIIFFQHIGPTVRIIDYAEKSNENLAYFAKIISEKPYIYGKHFFPHDMRVTEWGGPKFTRVEKARQLGIKATIVPEVGLEDGIEHVQVNLGNMWIDGTRCLRLIKALENYRYEYDANKQIYKRVPLHNWASHGADSMRYLCLSLGLTSESTSPKDLDKRYRDAMMGGSSVSNIPAALRNDNEYF